MERIGLFDSCVDTPEEIIMAAGFTPSRLFGDPSIQPEKANEHIPPTHCVWTRNLLERALRGDYGDIKGILATHGCDRTNREFDIWLECLNLKFIFFLNSPRKRGEKSLEFFITDMKELILQLEEAFGVQVSTEKLKDAINKMNEIRRLLKSLSELRKENKIKGSELNAIVKAAQMNDKEETLTFLRNQVEEIKARKPFEDGKLKKVLLTGSDIDDPEFIKFLEDLGFHIVIDDLCVGTKYYWNTVDESKDPLRALAEYHLSKPIYSTKYPSYERFKILKEYAEKHEVQGVINIAQKFCEPVLYNHPYMMKKFKELEIPYLFVEMTYNRESYKQLSTRFSAFAEII
ncbi:MAG: 2-hydroxyacyl-CoA dehydratase subunit D [Promethearchaeota archaeon]